MAQWHCKVKCKYEATNETRYNNALHVGKRTPLITPETHETLLFQNKLTSQEQILPKVKKWVSMDQIFT